jgi:hypothetical protein
MKHLRKWIIRVLAAVIVLAALSGGFYYFQVYRPIREFRKLVASKEALDENLLRAGAHKVLRWVPDHDAFVILCDVADESSIPVLIRSLRRVRRPDKNGNMICTTDHCFRALRKASGHNLESEIETWEEWFQNYKLQGSPQLKMKERAAALITEEYVTKYVRPLSDPVALAAHHTTDFDQTLLNANQITAIEVNPRNGKSQTVYRDKSKRPPNDGMVTGVPNARRIGFYYPASADQASVEVRVNHSCDVFGHIAVHLVVPNPLVLAQEQANANKTSQINALPAVHSEPR